MNCSGKHAAFLAACAAHGWDLDTYLDSEHPLQRHVIETVARTAGEAVEHVGVNSAGAPSPC